MLKSEMLEQLKRDLQSSIKEGKVALLFVFKEGTKLHSIMRRKIEGLEALVKGIDLLNAGGSADDICAALDKVIATVDEVIAQSHCEHCAMPVYQERTFLLGMKSKFQKLEELMTRGQIPMEEDGDDVLLN